MPLSPGQLLNNRYWIRLMLGQGGMGAVYEGWDARLRLRCAVKENRVGDEASQRQFEREAILLAKLHHPNLPRVTDHFIVPGQGQYLVMDFVEGEDLKQRQARLGPLPEADVLRWADQILNALAYLHKRGIIHRDIKPQNIKITPEADAVLVDFGLAKDVATEGAMTMTGAQGLTPGFAPPEQYKGGTDARTDIYAFGATLYALLTSEAPPDALSRVTEPERFVPLSRRAPSVSRPVAAAIDKALAMELRGRFASVDEMRTALGLPATERAATAPVVETAAPPLPVVSTTQAPTSPPTTGTGTPPMFTVKSVPRTERRQFALWGWVLGGAVALIALAGLVLGGLAGMGVFSARTATPALPRPPTATSGPTITPLPPTATVPSATPAPPTSTATRIVRTFTPTNTSPPTGTPLPETATAQAANALLLGGAGRIAFVAVTGGNPEIFTLNVGDALQGTDGSGATQLTRNKTNDGFPA